MPFGNRRGCGNSINGHIEQWRYGGRFMQEAIPPLLFILGQMDFLNTRAVSGVR